MQVAPRRFLARAKALQVMGRRVHHCPFYDLFGQKPSRDFTERLELGTENEEPLNPLSSKFFVLRSYFSPHVTLIYAYIFKEIVLLTAAISGRERDIPLFRLNYGHLRPENASSFCSPGQACVI